MRKGFTLIEIIIVITIFSIFTIVLALVLNDYLKKAEQNIQLLDGIRRLTETAEKVIQILNKANGPANSVKILSETEIQFDMIILGRKISCDVTVDNQNHQLIYREDNQPQIITIENVEVRFYSASSTSETNLPVKVVTSIPNPMNRLSKISLEFLVYPPGVR